MKIAIHHTVGSFSERWIEYCVRQNIQHKVVNCYRSDIFEQLVDCQALMWHHHQDSLKDILFAKQLLFAVQATKRRVFPDYATSWHFDDKVGQKYLFEGVSAPTVPTFVSFEREEALEWCAKANFPKVFKLRGGAGSQNVRIVESRVQAASLINQCFSRGIPLFDRGGYLKEQIRKWREGKCPFKQVAKGVVRLIVGTESARKRRNERGYVYFQDYIPNNDHDTRVVVIGKRAFAIKRMVRVNDFRASGSGNILYGKQNFSDEIIALAFQLQKKLGMQCAAFDFVRDPAGSARVLEVSYGFVSKVYDPCVGYWDDSLRFYPGTFVPQHWMVDMMTSEYEATSLAR